MDIGQQGQSRSCENPWEDMEGGQPHGRMGCKIEPTLICGCATAFTIHSQDTLRPNVFVDSAPSRPPSRVSTRGANPTADPTVG